MNNTDGRVAIVILNYKRFEDTINCIESFYNSTENSNCMFIVVDNASGNDSLKKIFKHFQSLEIQFWNNDNFNSDNPDILLVQNSVNKGYAAGNNTGLKIGYELGFKYLMVLNNDILFIEDCLDKLKTVLDDNLDVLGVGPLLLKGDNKSIDHNCAKRRPSYLDILRVSYFGRWLKSRKWADNYYYLKGNPNLDKAIEVDIISGSCMFFNTKKIKDIDFFDEGTFLYFEEAILHEKARMKGYKLMIEPNAKVIHLGAQTTKNETFSTFTLKCEYDSLKLYLINYRNLTKFSSSFVLIGHNLFIHAYRTRERLTGLYKSLKNI